MTNLSAYLLAILASAGTTTLLLVAAAWLGRKWIGKRLEASIQHEYDKGLVAFKREIDRDAEKLRLASAAFGEVQKATVTKRLEAVEATWKTILELQAAVPASFVYLDVLTDSEYLTARSHKNIGPALASIDADKVVTEASDRAQQLAVLRPFIGEYLWVLFSVYQSTLLRMVYLVGRSKSEPRKILWYEDKNILRNIELALGEPALAEFQSLSLSRVSWVHDHFTRKILSTMEHVVAGREFGEAAMKQAEVMESQLRTNKRLG